MRPPFWISHGKALWNWLRQVSGDAAYENYLNSFRRRGTLTESAHSCYGHDLGTPLSRKEFFLDVLRRRYNSVSRCC